MREPSSVCHADGPARRGWCEPPGNSVSFNQTVRVDAQQLSRWPRAPRRKIPASARSVVFSPWGNERSFAHDNLPHFSLFERGELIWPNLIWSRLSTASFGLVCTTHSGTSRFIRPDICGVNRTTCGDVRTCEVEGPCVGLRGLMGLWNVVELRVLVKL